MPSEEGLKVTFNPLAFTPEEVNEMLKAGYEPGPILSWYLTPSRRAQQIKEGERKE